MTLNPDDLTPPEEPDGRPAPSPGSVPKLDEDAAWRSIVENYGERVSLGPQEPAAPSTVEPLETPEFKVFERLAEPLQTPATWEDEGHFVPPAPPPLPPVEPRRRLAWIGLFGAPAMMLAAVLFGWGYPTWFSGLLVAGFIGGFGFLVATMPKTRDEDGSGDDGAIV
jgi:hypothetical protein